MATIVINSDDNIFVKGLVALAKAFKGAKVGLIKDDLVIERLQDELFVNEIEDGLKSGIASDKEEEEFLNSLLK